MRVGLLLSLSLVLAPLAMGATTAQDPERLQSWPRLKERKRVEQDVARLRKAKTKEMAEEARDALLADGAAVAPVLLEAFAKEKDEDARARVRFVLDGVCGAPHTRLLVPWFDAQQGHVRVWALRKAASGVDPGLVEEARAFHAGLDERKRRKPVVAGEREAASLLLVSTGDAAGLPAVLAAAKGDWKTQKAILRAVAAAVRGGDGEAWLLERLLAGEREDKSAALRLLAVAGTERTLEHLGPYLESSDNTLRVDAINACRGIVDGEAPLEKLPVFEAIELARKWQERIR